MYRFMEYRLLLSGNEILVNQYILFTPDHAAQHIDTSKIPCRVTAQHIELKISCLTYCEVATATDLRPRCKA